MNKKGYSLLQVIIIMTVCFITSGIVTAVIISKNNEDIPVSHKLADQDEDLDRFIAVYNQISTEYYESIDKSEVIDKAINGITEYLNEKYTVYMDQQAKDILMQELSGEYEGIGVVLSGNIVVNILPNTPAEKSGLLPNDIIIKINDINVTAQNVQEILKNTKSNYIITILRNNEELSININRDIIKLSSVESSLISDNKIGYIQLSIFSESSFDDFKIALESLISSNINGLIIDLRNNSGGYLSEVHKIAALFTKKDNIIYMIKSQNNTEVIKDTDDYETSIPIIILTNDLTASASEILTSALKDNNIASILGTKTFGKGKVQRTFNLTNDKLLKYTTALWLRPNGECIDNIGITPDYIIEKDINYDNQLEEAVKLLSQ